jgi:hypothetical protein
MMRNLKRKETGSSLWKRFQVFPEDPTVPLQSEPSHRLPPCRLVSSVSASGDDVREDGECGKGESDPSQVERWAGRDGYSQRTTAADFDLVDKVVLVDENGPDGGSAGRVKGWGGQFPVLSIAVSPSRRT